MLLGCIGDDFPGSSDLGNTLTKAGMRTVQYVGVPDAPAAAGVEAGVVALKSRSVSVEEAVRLSLAALDWLLAQGCEQILFKYCSTFDSTDDGNIGPVADALLDHGARIDRLHGEAGRSGRVVLSVRYAALGKRAGFGVGVHRATLFALLHQAVAAEGIAIETGCAVSGSDLTAADRRVLLLEGGRRIGPFDLIVDALGTRTPLGVPFQVNSPSFVQSIWPRSGSWP